MPGDLRLARKRQIYRKCVESAVRVEYSYRLKAQASDNLIGYGSRMCVKTVGQVCYLTAVLSRKSVDGTLFNIPKLKSRLEKIFCARPRDLPLHDPPHKNCLEKHLFRGKFTPENPVFQRPIPAHVLKGRAGAIAFRVARDVRSARKKPGIAYAISTAPSPEPPAATRDNPDRATGLARPRARA